MNKEVKIGLLAIISGIILYLGFNYLKGKTFFSSTNKYFVVYQNIDGLNVSNPVVINGFTVGRVSSIDILQEMDNQIIVEIDVNREVILGDLTVAILTNSDFMGSKSILLEVGNISHPLENGDTLVSVIDKGLAGLFENAKPITANIDVTIRSVNEILLGMQGAGKDMKSALEKLNITLLSTNKFIVNVNTEVKITLDGVNDVLEKIATKVERLEPILSNAEITMTKISKLELDNTVNSLNATLSELNTIFTNINTGKGSMGKILKEDSLYYSLSKTIADLDQLLIHFDQNPKHFLGPLAKSQKKIKKERQRQLDEKKKDHP